MSNRNTLIALMLLALACLGSLGYAAYSTLNFLLAVTPEEALALRRPLPEGWEAGVWSHGSYIRWHTLSGSPLRFLLGILAPIPLFWVTGWWARRVFFQLAQGLPTRKA